jgi:hypothetical protein
MYAVALDNPAMFWYSGCSRSYRYIKSTMEIVSVKYTMRGPTLPNSSDPVYPSYLIEQYNTMLWDEFFRVAEELKLQDRTRFAFVKVLHDYLASSVDYVIDNTSCFDPYGTLVVKDAVCQGYAETMKMFCDFFDIPCVCLSGDAGGPHMWNAIQMEDGLWYLVDVTWDDSGSYLFDDYLLTGLNTVDKHFYKKTFAKSHISDGNPYLPELNYSTTAYELRDISNFNETADSTTYLFEQYLVISPLTASQNDVYYEGILVKNVEYKTGATFTTPDDKVWTMIVAGDTDGDGKLTAFDYEDIINRTLREDPTVSSYEDVAADMARDGRLDILDMMVAQLILQGSVTEYVV